MLYSSTIYIKTIGDSFIKPQTDYINLYSIESKISQGMILGRVQFPAVEFQLKKLTIHLNSVLVSKHLRAFLNKVDVEELAKY